MIRGCRTKTESGAPPPAGLVLQEVPGGRRSRWLPTAEISLIDLYKRNQNCNQRTARAPPRTVGPFDIVPGEALAEDTRFELVRGCPQHAFQAFVWGFGGVRERADLGCSRGGWGFWMVLYAGECNQNRNHRGPSPRVTPCARL